MLTLSDMCNVCVSVDSCHVVNSVGDFVTLPTASLSQSYSCAFKQLLKLGVFYIHAAPVECNNAELHSQYINYSSTSQYSASRMIIMCYVPHFSELARPG